MLLQAILRVWQQGRLSGGQTHDTGFADIEQGGYVPQTLVPPSERRLLVDGVELDLKMALRDYVYRGEIQLVSARLYQGQTTNFRTPGSGFAAVFSVPCQEAGQTSDAVAEESSI